MQVDEECAVANLHIIAALSHNDKLQTRDDRFDIYAPTTLRGLFRTWSGENRMQNVERVQQTVRVATTCAERLLEEAQQTHIDTGRPRLRIHAAAVRHVRVCEALAGSRRGLHNLVQTYRDDPALSSRLLRVVTEIDDFLLVLAPHTQEMRTATSLGRRRRLPHDDDDASSSSAGAGSAVSSPTDGSGRGLVRWSR
jgi:hypothetical protein